MTVYGVRERFGDYLPGYHQRSLLRMVSVLKVYDRQVIAYLARFPHLHRYHPARDQPELLNRRTD